MCYIFSEMFWNSVTTFLVWDPRECLRAFQQVTNEEKVKKSMMYESEKWKTSICSVLTYFFVVNSKTKVVFHIFLRYWGQDIKIPKLMQIDGVNEMYACTAVHLLCCAFQMFSFSPALFPFCFSCQRSKRTYVYNNYRWLRNIKKFGLWFLIYWVVGPEATPVLNHYFQRPSVFLSSNFFLVC